ncbi:unnamed protein product (macronuclear) [Paramecium tetraurelia]|uniref:B30.2/SPRY domain-containing protein n=1 Tax=Paramecium tetraurelia TaxID=5888 RepID=A0EE87_PARTE|nr:uncharacterized protein GSPATT00025948001 [Paramecium tetraurelia]CAK93604.1 unnamed protein product [Paramecium tetraurelia]|eukprot:XP_001461001.1 hypothetical protein (macronuclear) [Paramecium tetraurelia strain d4-2]
MDQILFCINEKCTSQSRLLLTMADVPKHNDKSHKVVQFKEFKSYVMEKYGDADLQKIQKITSNEKVIKDAISKIIKEVKEKLDLFEINEIKKMPSLQQQGKPKIQKDITADLLKTVVEFQVEKIPKYGFILEQIDDRMNKLKTEVAGMLKAQQYDLQITTLGNVKYTWSDQFKANIYAIKDDAKREIEATTSFMGWSFACIQQQLTSQKRWETKLEIRASEPDQKTLQASQLGQSQLKKQSYSFAVGITLQKVRQQKGLEQQDLATVGHGFYLIRSDGWTCHNSDKNINWKQGLCFTPEPKDVILIKFDPTDGDLLFEQGKNKYQMKVERPQNEVFLFCVHLKGCKAKILD